MCVSSSDDTVYTEHHSVVASAFRPRPAAGSASFRPAPVPPGVKFAAQPLPPAPAGEAPWHHTTKARASSAKSIWWPWVAL